MLAIQEHLLTGNTPTERFALAKEFGFDAVEIRAEGFVGNDDALMNYARAMDATEMPISGLFMGNLQGMLSANLALRDHSIDVVRQALTDAHDLRIPIVTVIPQPAHAHVEMTAAQERELLIWFVRVVNDLAGAMSTTLCLLPLEPTQARVLNTLQDTYAALEEMRFHPFVAMSADLASLQTQNENGDLIRYTPMIRNLYVAYDDSSNMIKTFANLQFDGVVTLSRSFDTTTSTPISRELLMQAQKNLTFSRQLTD